MESCKDGFGCFNNVQTSIELHDYRSELPIPDFKYLFNGHATDYPMQLLDLQLNETTVSGSIFGPSPKRNF